MSAKHGQSPLTRRPDPGPRRRRSSRDQRGLDAAHPGAARWSVLHRRRRHAAVAERPVAGGDRLRQELPAQPRHRQRHQRQPEDATHLRPDRRCMPGRGAATTSTSPPATRGTRRVRHRPVRRRVHRRHRPRSPSTAGPTCRTETCRSCRGTAAARARSTGPVETTQIAPTILTLLGLNPTSCRLCRSSTPGILPGLAGLPALSSDFPGRTEVRRERDQQGSARASRYRY